MGRREWAHACRITSHYCTLYILYTLVGSLNGIFPFVMLVADHQTENRQQPLCQGISGLLQAYRFRKVSFFLLFYLIAHIVEFRLKFNCYGNLFTFVLNKIKNIINGTHVVHVVAQMYQTIAFSIDHNLACIKL